MLSLKNIYKTIKNLSQLPQKYRNIHSYIYKMDKAYMTRMDGSEVFDLTFHYTNPELKISRQFNFTRRLSENVHAFSSRIAVNVDKVLKKKQKKNAKPENDRDIPAINKRIHLFHNCIEVNEEILCEDLFNLSGDIRLKVIDQEYHVVINTPWIKSAVLPTSMLTSFPVYPSKFDAIFTDKNISEFTWFKSKDKINWTDIGIGYLYTPTIDDINHYLKVHCLPKNDTDCGPITEVISTTTVEVNPGQCPFEIRHKFTQEKLVEENFRVVTYNLLADLYSDSEYARAILFPYCPPYALNINYRKQLIIKELLGYNADIICLQEVDEKIFDNDLNQVLPIVELEGIFHKKGGTLREGLACFYNNKRFKIIQSLFVILGEEVQKNPLFSEIWSKILQNSNLSKRISERTSTLQIVLLESTENNEMIVVVNTHLYFHPDADHIRLLQGALSIMYIEDFIKKITAKFEKRVSLIFCGDFNSTPDCGIYKLFTTGSVSEDIIDWNSNAEESISGINFTQQIIMLSACGTPKYTNFTVGFQDCLDYIYCEKSNFEVIQVVPLPSYEELTAHTAIPSVLIPSDHLALVADLRWL